MTKILGLDLGTNSIGWAVVDKENAKIIDAGVRIFPAGKDKLGSGDSEVSRNALRREKRQQRRGYFRRKLRRIKLLEVLRDADMCPLSMDELNKWKKYSKNEGAKNRTFPNTEAFRNWLKMNPYALRKKGLQEQISLYELGRVFYHMIQHRGFLSTRKDKDTGKIFEGKEGIRGIHETKEQLAKHNTTLGSYLYSIYPKENQSYKRITDHNGNEARIRARYTLRDMYIHEFDEIWNKQAEHLGLDEIYVTKTKTRFEKGSDRNNRKKKKINYLIEKYGKENVEIKGDKIVTKTSIPLKEYLGGTREKLENGNIKYKANESVLFYQRPLRSQKQLLGKCSFEGYKLYDKQNHKYIEQGPVPAAVSHPEYEEFRALQYINNIEYADKKSRYYRNLDEHQAEIVMELFNAKKSNFKFSEIPKKLNLSHVHFNYDNEQQIPTNYTIVNLKPLFPKEIWAEHKNDIWHCFYFFDDNEKLFQKLKKDYQLKTDDQKIIEKINLKDDYGNVSLKAIRNITPFLKKGYKFHVAVILGGVRNAFRTTDDNGNPLDRWDYFRDSHQELEKDIINIIKSKNKEGEAIEQIKKYLIQNNYGFSNDDRCFKKLYHHSQQTIKKEQKDKIEEIENLRNPVVQQSVSETKRIVNELIEKYGKFDRINIELGRNIKAGKDLRQKMTQRIRENEAKNNNARERILEAGLRPTRDNVQKYLLFEEIEGKNGTALCPYTGKTMGVGDVIGTNNTFQIEHIFPRSTSLDDSFGNKTLCESKFNGLKGNLTPFQFYQKNADKKLWGAENWDEIKKRAFSVLPYNKAKRFTSETDKKQFDEKEFFEQQLNDSRYIAVKTKEIVSEVCSDVRVLSGGLTAELRHLWGLNNILQPVEVLDFDKAKVDAERRIPHQLLIDKEDKVIEIIPTTNKKPDIEKNEITIPGLIKGNKFEPVFKNIVKRPFGVSEEHKDGRYWVKLKTNLDNIKIAPVFTSPPSKNKDQIIIRGMIKNNYFSNDNLGRIATPKGFEDGVYRALFGVKNIQLLQPEKNKQPKKSKNQLLLYGTVSNGIFTSYIFSYDAGEPDGNYWALIDLDVESVEYYKIKNELPTIGNDQLLIEGNINADGCFTTNIDHQFSIELEEKPGKYWLIVNADFSSATYYSLDNTLKAEKDQRIVEGDIWVDKSTGEIKYDPKKNRDDHRHHAIDAMVVALAEQSHVQKLSTYYANRDEKLRGREYEKPEFNEPWDNFRKNAENKAAEILVSHKMNQKERQVLTNIRKTINKNGKLYKSEGKAARGQLHKDSIYGARMAPGADKEYYHIRKDVNSLTDAQIKKIVDKEVKKIIEHAKKEESVINKKIAELNKQLKKASEHEEAMIEKEIDELKKQIELLYTLKNNKGGDRVPIKKVRIKETIENAKKLKNKTIIKEKDGELNQLNQFVNLRNNHHVAIYKDNNGNYSNEVITFWEAANRKKNNLPIINKKTEDGYTLENIFQKNDTYILFLDEEYILKNIKNQKLLSKYLFIVQKISGGDYFIEICFRHHLDSRNDQVAKNDYVYIKGFGDGITGYNRIKPVKVNIDDLGFISL